MKQYTLIAAAVMCAAALAAPVASAQTVPLNATYTEHIEGPNQHPGCVGGFGCGSGTATGLGSFTTTRDFGEDCGCIVRTLTFSDGSTLVLDEDFISFTGPGGSASSQAPGTSEGHPGLYVFSWTVDRGTGRFAGATAGNGADDYFSAGLVAFGTLSGNVTTS